MIPDNVVALLLFLFILLVLAGVVFWQVHTFRRLRQLKGLFEHRLREIDKLEPDQWVIEGQAVPLACILSPLTQRSVIGYRILVEQLISDGKQKQWRTLFDHALINDFEVEDHTGRALVHADGARIIFKREYRRKNGLLESIPPALEQLLNHSGVPHKGWIFDKSFRWSEFYLEPGEDVCVYGRAHQEVDSSQQGAGYRDLPTRWVMEAPQEGPMIIVDMLQQDFLHEF